MIQWRYRHTVLALSTLGFFATMVARLVISPVVPDLTGAFDVSTTAIGLALSGMWGTYALAQFPSGVLGDRFGERTVILAAVGGAGAASLLLALAPSFRVFFGVVVALGGAAGLHYSVATTLLSREFDDIGRAIGVHVAGGPLAGLLAPVAATAAASRYDWRAALALGGVTAVPVFLALARRVDPTPPARPDQPMRERFKPGPAAELLARPAIRRTTALAVLGAFTWQATASFLPTFLTEFRGLSRSFASLLFSAYFVVHGVTQPVTGSLSDRYSRDAAAALTMLAGVAGFGLFVVGNSAVSAIAAVPLVGLAMSWGAPLQSRFMDLLSPEERGAGFGLVRTVYMVLGALGSVVTGFLADVAGWAVAFGLLTACMVAGSLLLAALRIGDGRSDGTSDG